MNRAATDDRLFEQLRDDAWRPEDEHDADENWQTDEAAHFAEMLGHELRWCRTMHISAECTDQAVIRWALEQGAEYEANAVVRGIGYLRFRYAGKSVALAITDQALAQARSGS